MDFRCFFFPVEKYCFLEAATKAAHRAHRTPPVSRLKKLGHLESSKTAVVASEEKSEVNLSQWLRLEWGRFFKG